MRSLKLAFGLALILAAGTPCLGADAKPADPAAEIAALKREIAKRTNGKLKLGPGVLYGSINKMLDLGLIEESDERPDPHLDDERRRYYRITSLGRQVARAEARIGGASARRLLLR